MSAWSSAASREMNRDPLPGPAVPFARGDELSDGLMNAGGVEAGQLRLRGRDVAVLDEGRDECVETVLVLPLALPRRGAQAGLDRGPHVARRLVGALPVAGRAVEFVGQRVVLGCLEEDLVGFVRERGGVLDNLVARREPGLDGAPPQQPVGKAVDGPDESGVHGGERGGETIAPDGRGATREFAEQALPDAQLQLTRRLAGERDRRNAVELGLRRGVVRRGDHLDEALDQDGGLARAGAGVHEHVHAARGDGGLALLLVRSRLSRAHSVSSSSSSLRRARNAPTAPSASSTAAERAAPSQTGA